MALDDELKYKNTLKARVFLVEMGGVEPLFTRVEYLTMSYFLLWLKAVGFHTFFQDGIG